jgi:hypothetical protein
VFVVNVCLPSVSLFLRLVLFSGFRALPSDADSIFISVIAVVAQHRQVSFQSILFSLYACVYLRAFRKEASQPSLAPNEFIALWIGTER